MRNRNSKAPLKWAGIIACAFLFHLSRAQDAQAKAPQAAGETEQLKFAVKSQLVQVHLTVKDGDRNVRGLTPSDFRLAEDGVLREIARVDTGTMPLQVALLLDASESMRGALRQTQEAATYFVESMQPGDRVTLITFNSDIRSIAQTSDDLKPILDGIQQTEPRGITKLYDALLFAMKYLSGREGRKAVVVFTDGEDTAFGSPLSVVLRASALYGYPIYTLSAGEALRNQSFRRTLRQLAEVNSARMFLVEDATELRNSFQAVADELRSTYVLNYYTQVPRDGQWHALDVRVTNPKFKVHTRKGFFASPGISPTLLAMPPNLTDRRPSTLFDSPVREGGTVAKSSPVALDEMRVAPVPAIALDTSPSPDTASPAGPSQRQAPLFKVESRFVEVPVVVESLDGKKPSSLSMSDFRVFEDEFLREIVFFRKDVSAGDMASLRDAALKAVRKQEASDVVAASPDHAGPLVLARYYLVIDDLMSDLGEFLFAKEAAKKILREYRSPLRPFSLHFTSEAEARALPDEDDATMIRRLENPMPRANHALTSDDGIMSVYQAYLIERGDAEATQLSELRLASNNHSHFKNDLGEVGGNAENPEMIRNTVQSTMLELVTENHAWVARSLDGLRAVVNAAAADPGDYPKTVIFLSSGFVLGKGSVRGDAGYMTDGVVAAAKRKGIRIFALDAGGLRIFRTFGVEAHATFLASNPHLERILDNYARGWQLDKESSLNQLASETGGRFIHNTNDLTAAAGLALNTTGQLYYLGFLSTQPADGRFHRIRVTTSQASVRLHARNGYVAARQTKPAAVAWKAASSENWESVLADARRARDAGDMDQYARKLELLAEQFPQKMSYWYNLGDAYLSLKDAGRAVEALQKAFILSPEHKGVGVALSRALVAAGFHETAEEILRGLVRTHRSDVELLLQLGRVYEASGRNRDAYHVYRSILDRTVSPDLDVYPMLIRTSMLIGRMLEAQVLMEDYLARGGSPDRIKQWSDALTSRLP